MLNNRNLILDKFEFRYYFNGEKILDLVHFGVHKNIIYSNNSVKNKKNFVITQSVHSANRLCTTHNNNNI